MNMKRYLTIFTFTILSACSSNNNGQNEVSITSDTETHVQSNKNSLDSQPAKTIIDFLKWYRDHMEIQIGLVSNSNDEIYDSTKFYTVDFEATENYLSILKSTGYISDKYIDKWRKYFEKCDISFKENPSNDGPPEGFEHDFIMLSQEYEEDLINVEKSKIIFQSVFEENATIKLNFPNGSNLTYKLTRHGEDWKIDDIENE